MKTPNLKWNLWFLGFVDALISPTYKEGLESEFPSASANPLNQWVQLK